MLVLAFDPGIDNTGWALIKNGEVQETGCLRPGKTKATRLRDQIGAIDNIVSRYWDADWVVIESYLPFRGARKGMTNNIMLVGAAYACALEWVDKVQLVSPQWKNSLRRMVDLWPGGSMNDCIMKIDDINLSDSTQHERDAAALALYWEKKHEAE